MSGISNQIPISGSSFYGNSRHQFGCTFSDGSTSAVHAMRLFYEFSDLKGLNPNYNRKDTDDYAEAETQNKLTEEVYRCSSEIVSNLIKSIRNQVAPQPRAFLSSYATSYSQTSFSNVDKLNATSKCVTAQMTAFSPMSMLYAVLVPVPIPCLFTQQFQTTTNVSSVLHNSNGTQVPQQGLNFSNRENVFGEKKKIIEVEKLYHQSSQNEADGTSKVENVTRIGCKGSYDKMYRRKDAARQLFKVRNITDSQLGTTKTCRTTFRQSVRPKGTTRNEVDENKREKIELIFYVKRARDQDGRVLYTSDESSSSDSEEEPVADFGRKRESTDEDTNYVNRVSDALENSFIGRN